MSNSDTPVMPGPAKRRPIYLHPVVMVGFAALLVLMMLVAAGKKKKSKLAAKETPPPAEWVQARHSIGSFTRVEDLLDATDLLYREGNAKWDQRNLGPGNAYRALLKWSECRFHLRQVDLEVSYRPLLDGKIAAAEDFLESQYQRLVFEENRARSGQDGKTLEQVYKAIMSLLPDEKHSLYQAAQRKLGQLRASQ